MDKRFLKIFKIGGKVVEDDEQLSLFLKSFGAIEGDKILVHGGGRWVTEMCQKLEIQVNMIDGRRITDAETLEVVKMMLAGVANKNVVSKLQGLGCNAIGLTGADGNTILASRRPLKGGVDFGYVGDVEKINAPAIDNLIAAGLVPVFAAMTHDGKGQLFNTNADTIASTIAVGMAESYRVELIYCFELNGVLEDISDPESVIDVINPGNYQSLKNNAVINSGMIPKIDNAFDAIDAGVHSVRIMNSKQIDQLVGNVKQVGTLIVKE
jgi:acetylglutamate kinase